MAQEAYARALDPRDPGQVRLKHLRVEEEQGRRHLLMGGACNLALVSQPTQEGFDLRAAHVARVEQPVKADKAAAPIHIDFLGAAAVVQVADALAQLVQQMRRPQWRQAVS